MPHTEADSGPSHHAALEVQLAGSAVSVALRLTRSAVPTSAARSRQRSGPPEPSGFSSPIQYGRPATSGTPVSSSTAFQPPASGLALRPVASSAAGSSPSRSL